MKHITTLVTALALATGLQAQTTGLDFTANDCAGTAHTLFADLDAGNVVIIDLVMMNCSPCVVASHGITDNVIPNTSDPGRVKFYSIGYTNAINCTQMTDWQTTNGFTHPVFAGMSAQTTYYGGFGMPTVIVLGGGSTHTVYYNEMGYAAGDNAALIQAVNDGLAAANSVQELAVANVSVSPNPATDVLVVSGARWTNAKVLDLQGRSMLNVQLNAGKLDVSALPAGMYVVRLTDATGKEGIARFEKR
jgi:hypothetical protein